MSAGTLTGAVSGCAHWCLVSGEEANVQGVSPRVVHLPFSLQGSQKAELRLQPRVCTTWQLLGMGSGFLLFGTEPSHGTYHPAGYCW